MVTLIMWDRMKYKTYITDGNFVKSVDDIVATHPNQVVRRIIKLVPKDGKEYLIKVYNESKKPWKYRIWYRKGKYNVQND